MLSKHISVSYIDFLTLLLAIFSILFILSNDDISKGNIQDVSQFLAEITWNKDSHDDVDIWLKDPNGNITYFKQIKNGAISLDVDDRGNYHVDIVRREVISIKSIIPGHYIINAMMYQKTDKTTTQITANLIKLQPFSVVYETKFDMNKTGEEKTIIQFDVDEFGNVKNIDTVSQVILAKG